MHRMSPIAKNQRLRPQIWKALFLELNGCKCIRNYSTVSHEQVREEEEHALDEEAILILERPDTACIRIINEIRRMHMQRTCNFFLCVLIEGKEWVFNLNLRTGRSIS